MTLPTAIRRLSFREIENDEAPFSFAEYNYKVEKILNTIEELNAEAASFARGLVPREGSATLVTLSGELGAGKTAFVKAAAAALGVSEVVTSPTFVLEKVYALEGAFKKLIHIDAYRLEKGESLATLAFDELMHEPTNLVMLEWPERVSGELGNVAIAISLEVIADNARKITYG